MTAKQLIQVLEAVDPETEVLVNRFEENLLSPQHIMKIVLMIDQHIVYINRA